MFRKLVLIATVGMFSNAANAGFFDSNDFKCGRDDAVKALSEHIKNDASGLLQSDYLTKSKFSYDKPVGTYESQLNSIVVDVTNVSTTEDNSDGLSCSATISVKIPQETLDVISNEPNYFRNITGGYGKIINGSVVWNDVSYNVKLADNKKEIIFSNFSRNNAADSMFSMTVLAANKEKIIKDLSQGTLEESKSDYKDADRELNAIWKELPDSARNALKKEQLTWVNEKAKQCGKLSDASSETMNASQRISIYQCQTKMTNARISYLSGSNN